MPYLIKIINACNYRLALINEFKSSDKIPYMYLVRNGKRFVKYIDINSRVLDLTNISNIKSYAVYILETKINDNLKNKNIYIKKSNRLNIALPTSANNFIGNIPFGSTIKHDTDRFFIGIQWKNVDGEVIDLDYQFNDDRVIK